MLAIEGLMMATSPQYYDLMDQFPEPGCAVCHLALRDGWRYLDSLLYEYVNTGQINDAFRAGRGLCNTHMWQILQFRGTALAITILCNAVVDEVLKIEG